MSVRTIINLTQHQATPDQIADGVVDLGGEKRKRLVELLTFDNIPNTDELTQRVEDIVSIAHSEDGNSAMIGGAPWIVVPLSSVLRRGGIVPLFSFSSRESCETTMPDGSVRKSSVFRHRGWVESLSDYW